MAKKLSLKTSKSISPIYVAELKSENAKLQAKIAKLEVQNFSYKNRIACLEKEMEKVNYHPHSEFLKLSVRERAKRLREALEKSKTA